MSEGPNVDDFGVVVFSVILKEVAPALEKPETPADAGFKLQRIGKSGTVPMEP